MSARTPAGRLVTAFGDVAGMAALYAPNVEWTLPESFPFPRPIKGRDAVVAFNHEVWSRYYRPDCEVTILDEVGDERSSAVRFIYSAHSRGADKRYVNEYTVFVRSGAAGITEVFEAFDTALTVQFLAGRKPGERAS